MHPFISARSRITLILTCDLNLNNDMFKANSSQQSESIPSAENTIKGTQLLKPRSALCTFTTFLPLLWLVCFSFGRDFRKMWVSLTVNHLKKEKSRDNS